MDLREPGISWLLSNLPSSKDGRPLILDAATGAGNTTLRLARAVKESGSDAHIISVDIDPASWADWAKPKLDQEGLTDLVEFKQADLCKLDSLGLIFQGIVCTSTLSCLGLNAVEAVSKWRDCLVPVSPVMIMDYFPVKVLTDNNANDWPGLARRLEKAADALSGREWCDEFPPDFWMKYLESQEFIVENLLQSDWRPTGSVEAYNEFLDSNIEINWPRKDLTATIFAEHEWVKDQVRAEGKISWIGEVYMITARRGSLRAHFSKNKA